MSDVVFIPVYTEADLTPRAVDTVKGIIADKFPDKNISLRQWNYQDRKILVLGKNTTIAFAPGTELVSTYSVPQLMTKANAATMLAFAIQRFLNEQEPIPFDAPYGLRNPYYAMERLNPELPVAIDIETTGNLDDEHTVEEVNLLSVSLYQPGCAPLVIYGAKRHEDLTNSFSDWQIERLSEILPQFKKAIYHNGKFDTRVLNRILGVKLEVWFDTMLAHHVLNQAAGLHGLKPLAQMYFGAEDWEKDLKKYTKRGGYYENIPLPQLIEYNGMDTYWTYRLYELLYPQIEEDSNAQTAFMLEMSAADFLLTVEQRGIPLDLEYIEELKSTLTVEAGRHLATMRKVTGVENFNPNSPKQVKEALISMGYTVGATNEESVLTVLEDARLVGDHDVEQFCEALLGFRKAMKARGTYAEGWLKRSRNGRVHPTFLVHGTSTGRLSSKNPNAQNVPRDKKIRRMVAV